MQKSIWMCPVCDARLERGEKSFACAAGHTFDIAREGYVNLVLAQHRRSAAAGDPKDSLRHRRVFLEAGHYAPLAAALTELLATRNPDSVLDVGCGEGYYLRRLAASPALAGGRLYGIDVAKEAIRLAAKAAPRLEHAVGNTYRLPVMAASVAAVLQVFAPSADQQIRRVLHPDGVFIEVKPGPHHLEVFRGMIYERAQAHTEVETPGGFGVLGRERVTFPLRLKQAEDVAGLVEMTPYKWHMNPETYTRVRDLTELQDTADFTIGLYRPLP
ncbi:MAG TPA: methyltransferase domain-containing protein [Candidatus Latescibacteria bacterium]|jgi:23S rRNA (guanine745-N1)-methyltransferase|nr:methyltransferase domain-containing protein [Candidatus Latescibacterota bacterium]HJP31953.1 methyltransferase domain-containing protein [Candidatus Latescibacterota bacterium]|tara:strand:+ start:396 stop:1211 length:816 start_codon:yes stop_codon:yes gene_type:complete